ncbi:MAG: NfeD family protein [bacterium]
MKTKILIILFIFSFFPVFILARNSAQNNAVHIIPIKGTIELGLSGVVKRAVKEAKEKQAKAIILEIDTYGGRVDAADEICGFLKSAEPVPTIAFVAEEAWSAGALIALGCKEIYMSPGSSIGAAEPRVGMDGKETADEKSVSAVRAKFKSLASENGYPVNIAQGMVDKDLEIKKIKIKGEEFILTSEELDEKKSQYKENEITTIKIIKQKGKLITLSADEAVELKLAGKIVKNREELLSLKNLDKFEIVEISPTWSENLVRFLTGPIVSSFFITLGFLGIIYELMYPGWGISGTIALVCLSLFFWGHYLIGMAEWFEILLLVIGVILLSLELFVVPGFGITGISGITLIAVSIFLAMVKHPNPLKAPKIELWSAFYTLSWSVILVFAGFAAGVKFLPETKLWKKIVLSSGEESGVTRDAFQNYLGKTGKTVSILRPSGRAIFDDKILDVLSDGEFIDKDKQVKVVKIDGNKVVVAKDI